MVFLDRWEVWLQAQLKAVSLKGRCKVIRTRQACKLVMEGCKDKEDLVLARGSPDFLLKASSICQEGREIWDETMVSLLSLDIDFRCFNIQCSYFAVDGKCIFKKLDYCICLSLISTEVTGRLRIRFVDLAGCWLQ